MMKYPFVTWGAGFTGVLAPRRGRNNAVRHEVACLQNTWRYLFEDMDKAIPRVQAEYWSLIVENGVVVQ